MWRVVWLQCSLMVFMRVASVDSSAVNGANKVADQVGNDVNAEPMRAIDDSAVSTIGHDHESAAVVIGGESSVLVDEYDCSELSSAAEFP